MIACMGMGLGISRSVNNVWLCKHWKISHHNVSNFSTCFKEKTKFLLCLFVCLWSETLGCLWPPPRPESGTQFCNQQLHIWLQSKIPILLWVGKLEIWQIRKSSRKLKSLTRLYSSLLSPCLQLSPQFGWYSNPPSAFLMESNSL